MAEFNSVISINATQAINTLNKLGNALEKVALQTQAFAAIANGPLVGGGFADVAIRAKAAAAEMDRLNKAARRSTTSVRGIGLSFKDVGRIIESQIIFAAISQIQQGFFEAADAAAEFQLQIARIAAIDQEQLGFDKLRGMTEKLAAELGRPLAEVGEAVFEALQNDIGTTAETFTKLSTDAQELALVTGGTLPQAVNALSSVYKSFGDEIEGVESISGQFFGTINAGRITLADLESSLGTLSPLAKEAGVGFKEMTNALATITLTGTKASVATTQLRNVFNKLIKPTDALKKVYQDLGVSGFQELSDRVGADGNQLGLVGGLKVLREEVKGSEETLSTLFNTIRGNLGVLNVLTNEGELYRRTTELSDESAQRLNATIKDIDSTAAREAAKNAAQLEVIFTRLGDRALDFKNIFTSAILDLSGESDAFLINLGFLTVGIGGMTTAIVKFGVATKVALPPVAAFFATVFITEAALAGVDKLGDLLEKTARNTATIEVERLETLVKTLDELRGDQIQDATDKLANVNSVVNKIGTAAEETGKKLKAAFDIDTSKIGEVESTFLSKFGDVRSSVLEQITKSIKGIDDQILEGTRRISSIREEIADTKFEFSLEKLTDLQVAQKRIQRSTDQIQTAYDDIAKVGLGAESEKVARASAEAAVASAKAALSAARQTKQENIIEKSKRQLISALQTEEALERRLSSLRQESSKSDLIKGQKEFEKSSAAAVESYEKLVEARRELNEAKATGADEATVAKLESRVTELIATATKASQEAVGEKILETFDLKDGFEAGLKAIVEGLSTAKVNWDSAVDQLRQNLADAPDLKATVLLTAQIEDLAAQSGGTNKAVQEALAKGGLAPEQLRNAQEAALKYYKEQKGLSDTVEDGSTKAQAAADRARLSFAKAATEAKLFAVEFSTTPVGFNKVQEGLTKPITESLSRLGSMSLEELVRFKENLITTLGVIGDQTSGIFGTFTPEQQASLTAGVEAALTAATEQIKLVQGKKLFDPANLAAATALLDRLSSEDLGDIGFKVDSEGFKEVNNSLERIDEQARLAKQEVAKIGTEGATKAAQGITAVSFVTNGLVAVANNAKAAYQSLLDIAKQAVATAKEAAAINAQNSSNSQGQFFGGRPTYRNNGGASRGQDTVPVMASPEEFFVNAKSSKNFLPELQAINAGNAPSSSGGVGGTNITIGDINVSATSDVPAQTGRDIALSLKRELRRGTTRL